MQLTRLNLIMRMIINNIKIINTIKLKNFMKNKKNYTPSCIKN